jgi:GT2 family glycosyltransferase
MHREFVSEVPTTSSTDKAAASIAVVICTHNRPAVLERCLRRLLQVDDPGFSVVVVDSAPNSSEAKSVASRYGAQYIISPLKGLSRARNTGTYASVAEIIAYLDDDMVPHRRWLPSLIAEFADKNVMAATGPILPLEFTEGSDVDLQLATEFEPWGPHRFQIDQSSPKWFERTNFGGVGDGNFALRRSAFEQMRGFDERLGRNATIDISEEHYAFFRLVDLSFKIAYAPQAIVFHPGSFMNRGVLRKRIADTVAFAAFLAWNHPSNLWRIGKFLVQGAFRIRRPSRSRYDVIPLSAKEKFASGLSGLLIFFHSLRKRPRTREKKPRTFVNTAQT